MTNSLMQYHSPSISGTVWGKGKANGSRDFAIANSSFTSVFGIAASMSSSSAPNSNRQRSLSRGELSDIRQKIRYLTGKLRDLAEQPFLNDVQRSQIFCIRIIINQLEEIHGLGATPYDQDTLQIINIMRDQVRRNENSLVVSLSHGTTAHIVHRQMIFPLNAIVDDLFEYHSDDEQT